MNDMFGDYIQIMITNDFGEVELLPMLMDDARATGLGK
jgi:hypothetical protein